MPPKKKRARAEDDEEDDEDGIDGRDMPMIFQRLAIAPNDVKQARCPDPSHVNIEICVISSCCYDMRLDRLCAIRGRCMHTAWLPT